MKYTFFESNSDSDLIEEIQTCHVWEIILFCVFAMVSLYKHKNSYINIEQYYISVIPWNSCSNTHWILPEAEPIHVVRYTFDNTTKRL